jgi:hypothetical protein
MKRVRATIVLGMAAVTVAACSSINTNSDQVGLHYSAGSFSDTTFDECVPSNKHNFDGPGDLHYVYPSGDRTYKFDDHAQGAEQGSITIVSADNVRMTVSGILSFSIDTEFSMLRKFHERIGLKYGANENGVPRWTELLQDYLGVALVNEMVTQGLHYNWADLYRNTDGAKDKWLKAVVDGLPESVKSIAKAAYFGNFTAQVPQPQPPQELLSQITEQQVQNERINTINAQAAAQAAEIAQMQQLVALLGPEGYLQYRNQLQCEQNSDSCVPYLPLPQGSAINVTPGG